MQQDDESVEEQTVEHEPHEHDRGLPFDLSTLLDRRRALALMAGAGLGAGLLSLIGCGSGDDDAADTATSAASSATSAGSPTTSAGSAGCSPIPEETAGPYPGDGSNGPNVLGESGVVRRDIRTSFGTSTGVAEGVPMRLDLTVLDTASSCRPLAGAAVYVWHCNIDGLYSLYSEGISGANYLRGVQETDSRGVVGFDSIFPACYAGRWPHIHLEVYRSVAEATDVENKVATTQIALPADTCALVYATDGYGESVRNLAQVSLTSDNVFRDGVDLQMPTVSGRVGSGLVVALAVGV